MTRAIARRCPWNSIAVFLFVLCGSFVYTKEAQAFTVTWTAVRGNYFWVECEVTADATVTGIEVRVDSGEWKNLRSTTWGAWVNEFRAYNGSLITFRARNAAGVTVESGRYKWPERTLASGSNTGTSGTGGIHTTPGPTEPPTSPPVTPTPVPTSSFNVTLSGLLGSSWWIQCEVSANHPVTMVEARINGGAWFPLSRASWGGWRRAGYVGNYEVVEFQITSVYGEYYNSRSYWWPSTQPVVNSADRGAIQNPGLPGGSSSGGTTGGGNNGGTTGGDTPLPVVISQGTCTPACAAGELCCQTTPYNNAAESDKGFECAAPTASGQCPGPDLSIGAGRLSEYRFETRAFDANSCAAREQCLAGIGNRRLLRFGTMAENHGQSDLILGDPTLTATAQRFQYDNCHFHYHFKGFAAYRLLTPDGLQVAQGRKQAFCLMDTQNFEGPQATGRYNCRLQGISAGWGDYYASDLDCQWIDITGVPSGNYVLEVEINPDRVLYENNYLNNIGRANIVVP